MISPASGTENLPLSRFTMNSNALDFASEKVLLTIPIESNIANHIAGAAIFGPSGELCAAGRQTAAVVGGWGVPLGRNHRATPPVAMA